MLTELVPDKVTATEESSLSETTVPPAGSVGNPRYVLHAPSYRMRYANP